MKIIKSTLILLTLFINSISFAGKIEKGFAALKSFDYFKAKELFTKSLKKQPSPASFGLATIYFRNDNPFHSLDSAYKFVVESEKTFAVIKAKKKVQYKKFGFDYLNILELRSTVSSEYFKIAEKNNSIESYNLFISKHPWSNELHVAIHRRDSIAFSNAQDINTSESYQKFLSNYPESTLHEEVKSEFYRTQYLEKTKSNSLTSFLEFSVKHPENPYVKNAEDRIYEIVTEPNTLNAFHSFVKSYPKNRNVGDAWRKLYQLYLVDFKEDRVEEFAKDYPDFPYLEELKAEKEILKRQLLPFKKESYFGFMDYNGEIVISAEYEQLGLFKEGIALASKNGLYGYIDKANRVIIDFQYSSGTDFEQGRAIVEKDSLLGMIDRTGTLIFNLQFKDLGTITEGLVYGMKDSLYGYYDKNSNKRISSKYTEAYAFNNGMAKVHLNEKEAFIDEYGTFIVPPGYSEISFFNDSLLIFSEDELYGLMRKNCSVVVEPIYDEIGQLTLNRALVVKDGNIGYFDGSGKTVIEPNYETFPNYKKRGQFNSNLAIVKKKGKFGIINLQGKVTTPLQYKEIGDISSLIAFSKGKLWGFMDLNGKAIIQPEFDYAESFKDGQAIVEKLTLQGVIDPKNKIIIPLSYREVSRFNKEMYLVSDGANLGLFWNDGTAAAEVKYQQIRLLDKDFVLLTNNSTVQYLYLPEKRIIEPKLSDD